MYLGEGASPRVYPPHSDNNRNSTLPFRPRHLPPTQYVIQKKNTVVYRAAENISITRNVGKRLLLLIINSNYVFCESKILLEK